jgi:DNA-binding response OmpR family regulator
MKVLCVDDEPNILELLRLYLEREGFTVETATDGNAALEAHRRFDPDLVLLDLMLPGRDGFEVCREIRRRDATPIIILTARDDDVDTVVGLELGADDYVAKPFSPRTLIARIRAVMRRTERRPDARPVLEVGRLRVDLRAHEVTVDDRRLALRPREFDLLAALAAQPGAALTRPELLAQVWGTDFPGETRTVDIHVKELRRKLAPNGPEIETLRGVGYRLRDEPGS